jgi:hypothetical protein
MLLIPVVVVIGGILALVSGKKISTLSRVRLRQVPAPRPPHDRLT